MLIQLQNSTVTFDTNLIDCTLDSFPPAFQIWEPPYSGSREYAIVCVPTYPQTNNVVLGRYRDITQCAYVFHAILSSMDYGEEIFKMPDERTLEDEMGVHILSEHQMEEKETGISYKYLTDDDKIIIAKAGEMQPLDNEPRVMIRLAGDNVSLELSRDYIARYYKGNTFEYVVLGASEPFRTQQKEEFCKKYGIHYEKHS